MRKINLLGIAGILLAMGACKQETRDEHLFTKLDPEHTHINFNNINVENEQINIFTYEYLYNGAGVAIGDINNDGLADIYFSSNNLENKLYLNKGNLEFEDITARSGTGCKPGWKTGVSMVDVNGDGWLDLYVCRSADSNPRNRRNFLLINNHDLTFAEQAEAFGLADDSYTTQAAFFDYDKDGDLDAFMLNHSLLSISNSFNVSMLNKKVRYPYVGNKFYRNDNGHFKDVSDSAGIYGPSSTYGLGVGVSDFNNDSWPDLYVSNDYVDNDRMYLNNQHGGFIDATDSLLTHTSQFSMGLDIADVNNDGNTDLITLDMLPEDNKRQKLLFGPDRYDVFQASIRNGFYYQYMRNMLQINNGDGTFSEVGQLSGISNTDWSWSALIADYNNDGKQDVFISNGYKRDFTNNDFLKYRADQQLKASSGQSDKYTEMIKRIPANKISNYAFEGTGPLAFSNVTESWGLSEPGLTQGAAYGDLDNDGDLDLVLNNMDAIASIYRNNQITAGQAGQTTAAQANFLNVKLKGEGKNTFGIGARVYVYSGQRETMKEMFVVRGFQSSVEPILHFGVTASIDSVVVNWPSGKSQRIDAAKVNATITLSESDANATIKSAGHHQKLFELAAGQLDFQHRENDFVDYKTQALLPRMYSAMGPAMAVGDVNGDGTSDVFIAGANGQRSVLYFGTKQGTFKESPSHEFDALTKSEAVDAVFFDADGDKDNDLYVVTGGYEFVAGSDPLIDVLFINDGKGHFSVAPASIPKISSSGSCARPADFDGDGDYDLFVGGRVVPGRYPEPASSYLLINDGKGNFKDGSNGAPALKDAGLVTDAQWSDVDKDGDLDLVVVGEWLPVGFFINNGGALTPDTSRVTGPSEGWWNCIRKADIDGDGDDDFILGNNGLNSQMKPTPDHPVTLTYADFDQNGSIDPLIAYYIQGQSYPYANRDELTDQLPSFKKRFNDYESYSTATLEKILKPEELSSAKVLKASRFQTSILRNDGGHFSFVDLPAQAQIAPVADIVIMDVNADAIPDLVMSGNLLQSRVRMGRLAGNYGEVFIGDGKGGFEYLPHARSGLSVKGDVRHSAQLGAGEIIFARNNDRPIIFKLANQSAGKTTTSPQP